MFKKTRLLFAVALSALFLVIGSAAAQKISQPDSIAHVDRQTTGNLVGLNVTNYGFLGNDLLTRDPSMEYPLGSQVDHLIHAGLWVGAIDFSSMDTSGTTVLDTLVTTGAVDGYWRTGGTIATEFTPRTRSILERSNLINKPTYSPDAVSEQDFICTFDDLEPIPRMTGEPHTPMGIRVTQRTYLWSSVLADAFVIVSWEIENVGDFSLIDLYLGMYAQMVSGYKGGFETWPASGWFYHNKIHYDEDLHLGLEHHTSFGGGSAPYWAGVKYLGAKPEPDSARVIYNCWAWNGPGNTLLDEDVEKYLHMSNGDVDDAETMLVGIHSPVMMLSVGPYRNLRPGESVQVDFAFAGGTSHGDIRENAKWAQLAYDHDYILPSPPPSPRLVVRPAKHSLNLWWDRVPESTVDPFDGREDFEGYRVYVTRKQGALAEDFARVMEVDRVDTESGYNTGFGVVLADEPLEVDGISYPYVHTLENLKDGFKYWVAVTSFDQGYVGVPSLESGIPQNRLMGIPGPEPSGRGLDVRVFPNPYHGDAVWDGSRQRESLLWFANLPERATIRIFSLSGDLVDEMDFDGSTYIGENAMALRPGEGQQQVLSGGMCAWDLISRNDQPVASGLYLFAVTDEGTGENFVGKFMVIR